MLYVLLFIGVNLCNFNLKQNYFFTLIFLVNTEGKMCESEENLALNYLLEQQDLKRKSNLLKNLKMSLESLMLDKANSSPISFGTFNGNATMFCRYIFDILTDGVLLAPVNQTVWSFVSSLNSQADFKNVYSQLKIRLDSIEVEKTNENYESLILEWIFYSLRQCSFFIQLKCLLKQERLLITSYAKNAFLRDSVYFDDFLVYIRAFESNNYSILSKIKKNIFHLNTQIEQSENNITKIFSGGGSINSSRTSMDERVDSFTSIPVGSYTKKTLTLANSTSQHRRMHSFPNIQLNLNKKENEQPTANLMSFNDGFIKSVPKLLVFNEDKLADKSCVVDNHETESKKELMFSNRDVFDLIHSVQINCECSPLDKENSHFIIADMAMAANELIKSKKEFNTLEPGKKYPTSSSIRIANETSFRTIDSLNNTRSNAVLTNQSPPQLARSQSFQSLLNELRECKLNRSLSHADVEKLNMSKSKSNQPSAVSVMFENSIDLSSISTEFSTSPYSPRPKNYKTVRHFSPPIANHLTIDELKTSESTLRPQSNPSTSLSEQSRPNRLTSQRSRRFSWEEIEDYFSAENIANKIIKRLVDRTNAHRTVKPDPKTLIPKIYEFEFLIKYFEYYEYLQKFFETKNYALNRSKKPNNLKSSDQGTGTSSAGSTLHPSMSASTIYLSHSSTQNENFSSPTDDSQYLKLCPSTPVFNKLNPTGQTSVKVRSAALMLAVQPSIDIASGDKLSLQSESFSLLDITPKSDASLGLVPRILGDDLWAPVREQLILNLTPKQKRQEQMQNQYFRCADCGVEVKPDKIKTFHYCEYFSKYFCRCCHINQQSYIPAYVIFLSDYRTTFEVSKKAKNFLEKIYNEPLITLDSLNPNLFRDEFCLFSKMKKLRIKLYNCKSYLNSCRFAADLKSTLYAQFDDFIINDQHVYSIATLYKLKKTNYYDQLKHLLNRIIIHIKTCELCSQQGYICGFCQKSDLLYPFDFETVDKCPDCLACYHKSCFKSPDQCPRCVRKRARAKFFAN